MAGRKYIPSEFDAKIGHAITVQRVMRGLSQKDLARHLGVTFQQVQKYETGDNRLSAARLYKIAELFEISVDKLVYNATSKFTDDKIIQRTMDLMYSKMDASQRRMMLKMASYIAAAPKQ